MYAAGLRTRFVDSTNVTPAAAEFRGKLPIRRVSNPAAIAGNALANLRIQPPDANGGFTQMKFGVSTRSAALSVQLSRSFVTFGGRPRDDRRTPGDSRGLRAVLPEKRVDTLNSFCYSPCSPFLRDSGPNPRWLHKAHLHRPSSAFEKENEPALARLNTT
jgi:hypothetical protein